MPNGLASRATVFTAARERMLVKVGLAHTDADGARGNLAADIPGWDFEAVRMAAREKFVERLDSLFTTKQQSPDTKGGELVFEMSGR